MTRTDDNQPGAAVTRVLIAGQHAPNREMLSSRLDADRFVIDAVDALPAHGPIEADVLVTQQLTTQQAARVQAALLQVPGAGLDDVAIDALPPSCRVCNCYEHEIPIAEYVMHAVLDWRIFPDGPVPPLDATGWPAVYGARTFHGEAFGCTIGIVGFGHIGRTVARRARALGMRVCAITRRGAPDDDADEAVRVTDLVRTLPTLDVLVLCCPLDDSTRGLVGRRELDAMRSDALLVNVARGPVVDPGALYEALSHRRIGRAVIDVWYRYPGPDGTEELTPAPQPFHELPNVRATPHMSGWTRGMLERRFDVMARNIRALADGHPLVHEVPRQVAP